MVENTDGTKNPIFRRGGVSPPVATFAEGKLARKRSARVATFAEGKLARKRSARALRHSERRTQSVVEARKGERLLANARISQDIDPFRPRFQTTSPVV